MKAGDIAIKGMFLKTGKEGWIKLEDIARTIFEVIVEQNKKSQKQEKKQ